LFNSKPLSSGLNFKQCTNTNEDKKTKKEKKDLKKLDLKIELEKKDLKKTKKLIFF